MAKSGKPGRLKQLRQAYTLTKQGDSRIGLYLLLAFLGGAAVGYALFWLIPPPWLVADIALAVMVGVLAALFVFAKRATASQVRQIEGRPGAAVAVLSTLRRGWRTDQAIAFNRQQDVVHRLVGPPGIVLIGEGNASRVKALLAAERTRHQRFVAEAPVHEVLIGDGTGQVPLGKLVRHVTKMKRQLQPAQLTDVLARLKALDASRSTVPVPKGPMPTCMKGQRGNLRGR